MIVISKPLKFAEISTNRMEILDKGEGVNRVLEEDGKFAYITRMVEIDYIVNRNCKLTRIGGPINDLSYAFAVQKGKRIAPSERY